jgi:DNA repair exonuclease SbcCD ATPase subunit
MVDPGKFSNAPPVRTPNRSDATPRNAAPKTQNPPQVARTLAPPAKPAAPKVTPKQAAARKKPADFSSLPFWTGLALSMLWVGIVALALMGTSATHTFAGLPLVNWAIGISAVISPVGMIWMVTAYLQRAADVQSAAEPLRRLLMMITGESGAAEIRVRRFNQAVREQLDLLRSTQSINHGDLMAIMERVRQHKNELEQFEQHSIYQVKEVQEVVRRSMQHIEQLMEDKFTMLRILDSKMAQTGDGIAQQTESVREHLSSLLQEIESNTSLVGASIEHAMLDSKKLADTARSQEMSLISAAESASATLQDLSGKIDTNIARFLERAGSTREEAERLAHALETQTRSLDEFSNTLPVRVSEAESVLRGVADRLYASEQMAREQAASLAEKLSAQVVGLEQVLDRFGVRLTGIDGSLQQRRNDLDGLVVRVSGATDDLAQQLDSTISNLGTRAESSLKQFAAVNEEARRGADAIAAHLAETAARYDAATRQLSAASESNKLQWNAISGDIGSQLAQFDALQNASQQASDVVQTRAATALQNLQQVLERLLAARDATQSVSETLTGKLRAAVDHNEATITRINETTQMAVRALGVAAESLGRQEDDISSKSQAAESALRSTIAQLQEQARVAEEHMREQNNALTELLKENQERLDAADMRLQTFATRASTPVMEVMQQIEMSTSKGQENLNRYSDSMQEQLSRLQLFNTRISGMGEEVGRVTADTLNTIEQVNSRFLAVRAAQEETARSTLDQFSAMADRIQREVGNLGDHTVKAVTILQEASILVGDQVQNVQREALESGTKIQTVTSALQTEASQIRSTLQKQADDLNADLARAERQFVALGESLKQRTDAAGAFLDRMAEHYEEVTRTAADEFTARASKLEQTATAAHSKVEALSSTLAQQLSLIGNGTTQLEAQSTLLTGTNGKTLQQLSILNEKIAITQEAMAGGAQQTIARLEETNSAFQRQQSSLSDAAQNAVILIQKAGASFGEQAGKMLDTTHQVEQNIRSLNAATTAFADQSTQIRSAMEQNNLRLISSLNESVSQLDSTGAKLHSVASAAATDADQTSVRYSTMARDVSERIGGSSQELLEIAGKTETTLNALGANVTQQVASLNLLGEQLELQNNMLASTNENQRTQLVDLFAKLGTAHSQASDVAERTIARLTDALQQIQRQLGALGDQSQTALADIRTAGTGFADQSGMLLQHAQQAEQQARTVLSVTSALQDQARQLREALHNENERSSELLNSLLGKINAGNVELREFNSTAEVTLTSLQHGVNSQTTALGHVMQQIIDRQRSLTTALDAQRDVLNGLLSRLTLAQDETASMAERSVARLTDSTQQIAKQMDVVDTQAQTTLASVRAAAVGFADEAGTLNLNAQQTEQQARGMLSVTAAMQDQARQLRESLQSESSRVIEQLNGVIAKLIATSDQLKEQSNSVTQSMDKSVQEFTSLVKTTKDSLNEQAETLTTVTEKAEKRMASAGEKVRTQFMVVTDVAEQTEHQANKLADTAEHATSRLATLRSTLADSDKDGRDLLAQAASRLHEVKATLQRELEEVAALSQLATQQVMAAGQDLIKQSDALRVNLATSESALTQAATLVRDESTQIPVVLNRSTAQIVAAGTTFKDKGEEINKTMVDTADRYIGVTGAIRDTMMDEARQLDAVAASADRTLRQFNEALAEQLTAIKQGTTQLSAEQTELVEKTTKTMEQLSASSERLALVRTEALRTTEKLASEFKDIESSASATTVRLSQANESLGKNVLLLTQMTERAEGQMMGASQNFREQFERVRTGLQMQIEDINRGLMQISAQLERTGTTLQTTTTGTIADVERLAGRFESSSKDMALHLTDRTARMRVATEEVAKLLNGFGDQMDVLLNRLSAAGDGIKNHENDLTGQLQTALSHLSSIAEKLESNRMLTADVSDVAISRLSEVARMIEKQTSGLKDNSVTITGLVREVGQVYTDQSRTLNHSVVEAQSQILSMNKSIDEMQQRTDRMRFALKMQGEDLMGSLAQILHQLSSTGDGLSDAVDQELKRRTALGLGKIN